MASSISSPPFPAEFYISLADSIASRYADLVYDGRWWTPEREALDAAVNSIQRHVTGSVRLKLFKGSSFVQGRESPHSLYHEGLATFGADDVYKQKDAEGFIRLYGLAVRTANERERRLGARLVEAAD